MKKTFQKYVNGKYETVEADMVDVNGVLLEEGQTIIYARASKSAPSHLEKGKILKVGDGFLQVEVIRTAYRYKEGHWKESTEPEKIRLTGCRGCYGDEPIARFSQVYILS